MILEAARQKARVENLTIDFQKSDARALVFENHFDFLTFRDYNKTRFTDDNGNTREFDCNERYYTPPELNWLLKTTGLIKIEIFGARLGAFSRKDTLTPKDFKMLVVAQT